MPLSSYRGAISPASPPLVARARSLVADAELRCAPLVEDAAKYRRRGAVDVGSRWPARRRGPLSHQAVDREQRSPRAHVQSDPW